MTKTSNDEEKLYGGVVLKVIEILDFLKVSDAPLSNVEIATKLGVTKGTASKILHTMTVLDLVCRDEDLQHYAMGTRLIAYGEKALEDCRIEQVLKPYVEEIHQAIGENVHVGVQRGGQILYVAKKNARDAVTLRSKVGDLAPLYCTAMGKAMLAAQSDEAVYEYVEQAVFEKRTDFTILEKEAFLRVIDEVRREKVAFDREENKPGVFCIAVAIATQTRVLGAISVSFPKYRLTEEIKQETIKRLLAIKEEVENQLR